jgi:hypothetical protein
MGPNIRERASQWMTPHGMGTTDHTGKLGSGGEFAKQATQWLTPNVPNGGRSVPAELVASKGMTADGEKRTVGLESQVRFWPTPAARDYRSESAGGGFVTERMSQARGQSLSFVVTHSLPQDQPIPDGQESSRSGLGSRRRLNPVFGCWLMNWPCWWTNPAITSSVKSETELYRCRQRAHLSFLLGEQDSSEWRKAA